MYDLQRGRGADTATPGDDFAADPVVVSWADREAGSQGVQFAIINDTLTEEAEAFTVQLSAPTGGAIVGPQGSVNIAIEASDQPTPPPPPPPSSGGGGGRIGLLSLLLMGFAALRRFPAVFSRDR